MAVDLRTQELRRTIRRDLSRSSQTAAPPLGHLAGLHRMASAGDLFALSFDPGRPAMAGGAGMLEVAMLADLALGGAIRNRVGLAVPMPTISMTIQFAAGRASEVVWADGECSTQLTSTATSRSRLRTSAGEVIGDAQGVFSLPPLPYDGPGRPMPWDSCAEQVSVGIGGERGLRPAEECIVDQVAAHAAGTPNRAWGTTHVERQMAMRGDTLAMTPTEAMINRLGHVQGGALFTAAILAAATRRAFPIDTLVTGTIEYVDAAKLDDPILAPVTVLRASRRSLFASVALVQDRRTCCHVATVFRR